MLRPPPIGPACGTLVESDLHRLVDDVTLAQKVGIVHGATETTDPQTGSATPAPLHAFPVIDPSATGQTFVAGFVGQAGVDDGVRASGYPVAPDRRSCRRAPQPCGDRAPAQVASRRRSTRAPPVAIDG